MKAQTKITVSPTETGYRLKIKRPKAQPVFLELTDFEMEQLKTVVTQAWWQKHKVKVLRKYDVTEEELLNFTSPLDSFKSLVKNEETVLGSSLQNKRKQKAVTNQSIQPRRSIGDFQPNLHSFSNHY